MNQISSKFLFNKFSDHILDMKLVSAKIREELALNIKPSFNLSTFVTIEMELEANELIIENFGLNHINFS